jgi:sugar phosphate isomerase/epimerase
MPEWCRGNNMLRVGLNPYGLTWHLGLQGHGTPRANPAAPGLDGFIAIATELGAEVIEIFDPWLRALDDAALARLKDRLDALGMVPVISAGLNMMGPIESALRSARALDAQVIRLGISPVLCGARGEQGATWAELNAAIRAALADWGPRVADEGRWLAIENHQDFGSAELVAFCEGAGRGVGITFDTGNAFPVLESPLDFAARVAPHLRHLHLKDYRVQFTPQGYRLVRCAIGDGAVPFAELVPLLLAHQPDLNAVLEPGALEFRHVRFLEPQWWQGYAPMDGQAVARCLAAAQVNRLPEDADPRTPWERGEDGAIEAYELDMIRRSAANMRALGLMRKDPA